MLRFTLGNTAINGQDVDIPVVLRSSIFPSDTGKIPGSFIFNFRVPYTDELKRELQFSHRPARKGMAVVQKPFELNFGVLHYAGTANVVELSDKELELSMPVDTGNLNVILKEIKLADLDLGGQQEIMPFYSLAFDQEGVHIFEYWENNPPPQIGTYFISFPGDKVFIDFQSQFYNNAGRYVGKQANVGQLTRIKFSCRLDHYNKPIENTNILFQLYLNGTTYDDIIYSYEMTLDQNNSCYFDYQIQPGDVILYAVSARSALYEQTQWVDFWMTEVDIEFRPIGIYPYSNTVNKFYPDSNFAVFPFENPAFFDAMADDWFMIDNQSAKELYSNYFPILNYWINDEFPLVLRGSFQGMKYMAANLFSPCIFVAYLVEKLLAEIHFITPYNPFVQDPDLLGLVLFNGFAENNYFNKNFLPVSQYTRLNDHVPDMTIGTFLRELCRLWGIAFKANTTTKTITFKWLNEIMDDTTSVRFRNDSVAELRLTPVIYNGFLIKQNAGSDNYISENFKPIKGLNLLGSVPMYEFLPQMWNSINDCYYVTSRKQYFVWNYDNEIGDLDWVLQTDDFFLEYEDDPVQGLEGEQFTIESNIAPLMDNRYYFHDRCINAPGFGGPGSQWRRWIIPSTKQPGIFEGLPPEMKNRKHSQPYLLPWLAKR